MSGSGLWIVLAVGAAALVAWADETKSGPPTAEMVARSVAHGGDVARLSAVLAKARRGEAVTIAVIGGSITQGAAVNSAEQRWGDRVQQWWREKFPKAKFTHVNAGIGATGSDFGACRVAEDVLARRPDLVLIEFAVNDPNDEFHALSLEGLVRQVLKQPDRPAAMLLLTMDDHGRNAQGQHLRVAGHYGLPAISYRDALWPEVAARRLAWSALSPDTVHPNAWGHGLCADLINDYVGKVLAALPADEKLPAVGELPRPLVGDTFEYAAVLKGNSLRPVRNEGWTVRGGEWVCEKPGGVVELEVDARAMCVRFYRIRRGEMGVAEASVDGGKPVRLNGWFDATWGGYYHVTLLSKELAQGKHRLTLRLLEQKDQAAPGAAKATQLQTVAGHLFRLQSVLVAGLKDEK